MADNKLTKEQEQFCVAVAGGSLLVDAYISDLPFKSDAAISRLKS